MRDASPSRPARIGSVIGRYYAMDRDARWDRVQQAHDLLVHGRAAHHAADGPAAVRPAYERGETDEFVTATTVGAEARIRPGDAVIAFNFRPDRMREITRALAEPGFAEVDRGGSLPVARYADDDRVPRGLAVPGRVPPGAAGDHAVARDRRARRHAAARRRDGEVPARDVLLQRRRGDPVRGRATRAGSDSARRADVRPQAADERERGGGGVRAGVAGGPSRASASSTSPTPTWSATRA